LSQDTNSKIPKIIHQIWLGPFNPPQKAMDSWVRLHPSWEYHLWTEDNLPDLINQKAFDDSDDLPQKSDILRYDLLYRFGGIFIDADEYCLRPIDELIDRLNADSCEVFAVHEGNKGMPELIANGILGCIKSSPFMEEMIKGVDISKPGSAWEIVGPKYLTEVIASSGSNVHILDSKSFLPVHHRDKRNRKIDASKLRLDPEIYGIQLWGSTNCAYEPVWYKHPFKYLKFLSRKLRNKMFLVVGLDD
jgi:mannosyltransferase OCH1-like enzyme